MQHQGSQRSSQYVHWRRRRAQAVRSGLACFVFALCKEAFLRAGLSVFLVVWRFGVVRLLLFIPHGRC